MILLFSSHIGHVPLYRLKHVQEWKDASNSGQQVKTAQADPMLPNMLRCMADTQQRLPGGTETGMLPITLTESGSMHETTFCHNLLNCCHSALHSHYKSAECLLSVL